MSDRFASLTPRTGLPPSISCIVPAYNEARNLPQVLPHILETLLTLSDRVEVIVIDDGSRDDTVLVMHGLLKSYPQLVFVQLSRNFGKEAALTAGLDEAQGEVVLIMDADGQHPVQLVPQMLARWQAGVDVVYAVRQTRHDQSKLHALLTKRFYKLINWGNRVKIPANAGDFRLMDRAVVQALCALPERNRFMKGLYAWVGFQSESIKYDPLDRLDGKSNFGLKGSLTLALTGLFAFSAMPLRLVAVFGLCLSIAAVGYGSVITLERMIWGASIPGYATIVVGMMLFSGIQLLSLGVMAEYVAHIYEEVKGRPSYVRQRRTGQGLSRAEDANSSSSEVKAAR